MNSTSPAHSAMSVAAVVGGGSSNTASLTSEDFHLPADLIPIHDRKEEALLGQFFSHFDLLNYSCAFL